MLKILNKLSLTFKVLPPIIMFTFLVLVFGGLYLINTASESTEIQIGTSANALQKEQDSAQQGLLKSLQSKANIIGRFMAKTAPDLILSYDYTALESYQKEASTDTEVAYTAYLKVDGTPYQEFNKPKILDNIVEYKYPITFEEEELGTILIGMSKSAMLNHVEECNNRCGIALE